MKKIFNLFFVFAIVFAITGCGSEEKTEKHILRKLNQETRGGKVTKIAPNTFLYKRKLYNTQEIMPWVKSFVGNIISVKDDNKKDIDCFYEDIEKMANIYE